MEKRKVKEEKPLPKTQSALRQTKTRRNFCSGFIGTNRTGKSSIARLMAKMWKKANPGKKVMAFDPQDQFTEVADDFIDIEDRNWPVKALELRNGLLILDDYRLINEQDKPVKNFGRLLSFREHYNIDIIYICHNPRLVINLLTYFTTHYYIFYTNATEGSFKDKIPNYSLCYNASVFVNAYVNQVGRGDYPKFHYVVIDTEKQKMFPQNMPSKYTHEYIDKLISAQDIKNIEELSKHLMEEIKMYDSIINKINKK